jgi:GxxExxY protein
VIGCAFTELNTLGTGFLEKVYENALVFELRTAGLSVVQQHGVRAYYIDVLVGDYTVDLLVGGLLLVELKTVKALEDACRMQCINYLKATRMQLCLLLRA